MLSAAPARHGAVALLGSGEYLPAMDDTDRLLMDTLGGPKGAVVALIPAASGLEHGAPERWNRLGEQHFAALGATPIALHVTTREHCFDSSIAQTLRSANFVYFSGGNPGYLVDTLQGTPVWSIIAEIHRNGGVLAGCSAGAMMLGGYTRRLRGVSGQEWQPAMGVAPRLAVLPHFDRFGQRMITPPPTGVVIVGVDENTALVRLPSAMGGRWHVYGQRHVTVFGPGQDRTVYRPGDLVPLPDVDLSGGAVAADT